MGITPEEVMAKALKTEEPAKYLGEDVILKALNFKEDIIVSALVNEVLEESTRMELSKDARNHSTFIARVLAVLHLSLHRKSADGKSIERVFPTMESISNAANSHLDELAKLYVSYSKSIELTLEEKKS